MHTREIRGNFAKCVYVYLSFLSDFFARSYRECRSRRRRIPLERRAVMWLGNSDVLIFTEYVTTSARVFWLRCK